MWVCVLVRNARCAFSVGGCQIGGGGLDTHWPLGAVCVVSLHHRAMFTSRVCECMVGRTEATTGGLDVARDDLEGSARVKEGIHVEQESERLEKGGVCVCVCLCVAKGYGCVHVCIDM